MARGRILVLIALALGAAPRPGLAQPDGARRDAPPGKPAPPKPPVMTKAPVLLQAVNPIYPPAALAAGKTADVKVRLHIDATGVVTQVEVVTPVGDGFDEAARTAAAQYVFDPAEFDGKPGPIVVETTIHFVIKQEEPPPPPPPPPTETAEPAPLGHAGNMKAAITIRGEVLELGTRRRLPGAIVSVEELGLDAITDNRGTFAFHGVAPGSYHLIVAADHYDRARRAVELAKGEALDLKVRLRPSGGNPYETVVEGEREVIEVTRRKLVRQQLTSVPGTFGDPIRAIQALPGIARAPFGVGVLIIRGSNPDDTGIFIDGHRVPGIFHFLGGPSILNPEFVDSIDLYPGGFPARFGRLHGGVVAIETRPSKSDGVHGSASIDILNAAGYVRAPISKHVSIAVAARRSYLDFVLGAAPAQAGRRRAARRGALLLRRSGPHRLGPGQERPGQRARPGLERPAPHRQLVARRGGLVQAQQLDRLLPDHRQLRATADGRPQADPVAGLRPRPGDVQRGPGRGDGPVQLVRGHRGHAVVPMRVAGRLDKRAYLDSGLDYESRVTTYDVLAAIGNDIRDNGDQVNLPTQQVNRGTEQIALGFHADLALDLGKLRLIPGVRWDGYLFTARPGQSVDPRLVARYKVDPRLTAKAYLGVYHQPPQPEAFDARFGNPNIGIERGIHTGVGVEATSTATGRPTARSTTSAGPTWSRSPRTSRSTPTAR